MQTLTMLLWDGILYAVNIHGTAGRGCKVSAKFSYRLFLSVVVVVLLACVLALAIPASAAANGGCTKTIHVRPETLEQQDGHDDIVQWHFIINQIDAGAAFKPGFVHVVWDNGFEADVALEDGLGGEKVGHYTADRDTVGSRVTDATAEIYCDWDGEFNLSHIGLFSPPVPELSTVLLLGAGLVGVAGVMGLGVLRRRTVARQ
jgi:hypothetical protein